MDYLDAEIMIYNNVRDTAGHKATFADFIRLCLNCKDETMMARSVRTWSKDEYKRIKNTMPTATLSGTFTSRKADALIQHSGLMGIDIDNIPNVEETKQILSDMDIVAYVSESIGGCGLFAVVPIAYPEHHREQFDALERDFKQRFNITLDTSGKDVCRQRIIAYDPTAVYRPDAIPYTGRYKRPEPTRKESDSVDYTSDPRTTFRQMAELCRRIDQDEFDITGGHEKWMQLAFAMSEFGQDAEDLFLMISRHSNLWKGDEATRAKYRNCMKHRDGRISIGTFFYICQDAGYEIPIIKPEEEKEETSTQPDTDVDALVRRICSTKYNPITRMSEPTNIQEP